MSPLKQSRNLSARMGRWSASHWKTAVFGWLAFVVASVVIGLILFGLTVRPLGLALAGPILIAAAGFASSEVRWRETLVYGLAMTAFCVGLFKFALGLPIPLAPWLMGY